MPGTFSKSARPKRPGAYFNFVATQREQVLPSSAATVCVPVTSDWGPFKTLTLCDSLADYQAKFGPTTTTPGYIAVHQAFKGEGVPGRGGAGQVLVYRTGSSSAARASRGLNNTTPARALTLRAVYEGTYGNSITVTTQVNAEDNTRADLLLYVGGLLVEEYTYSARDIRGLAAEINAISDWVEATADVDGVALAAVTSQALTGGNDGGTLTTGDWTDVFDAVETARFGLFAPYNLTDPTVMAALKTWAANLNIRGKRFMTVVGGALDEGVVDANTRSASLAHPDIVNIGVGGVEDDLHGTLSTAQLAPRIAGILAARGEERSLTYALLAGVRARNFPTEQAISAAFDRGTVVLSQTNNANASVRIEKGLTTYTGGDENRPYLIYRNPKYVRTMHGIETELTEWAEQFVIGLLQVNEQASAFVLGEARARIGARVDRGVLQPNPTVVIDPDPPASAEDEFIALLYGVRFGRSVEQVFNTVNIG